MSIIFIPSESAESWKAFLAQPDRQWKTGFSARSLAYAWQSADGFPTEVGAVLRAPSAFPGIEPLLAIPELKVPLPGGGTASQTDLWVFARWHDALVSIAVEGKVAEPLGPTVTEWLVDASRGKDERLQFLLELLALRQEAVLATRYQLLHRAASAIIQAQRFTAAEAVLLIHSFSPEDAWFEDFVSFAALLGVTPKVDELARVGDKGGVHFYVAWVRGDPRFLEA